MCAGTNCVVHVLYIGSTSYESFSVTHRHRHPPTMYTLSTESLYSYSTRKEGAASRGMYICTMYEVLCTYVLVLCTSYIVQVLCTRYRVHKTSTQLLPPYPTPVEYFRLLWYSLVQSTYVLARGTYVQSSDMVLNMYKYVPRTYLYVKCTCTMYLCTCTRYEVYSTSCKYICTYVRGTGKRFLLG